jgi:hypothetical protein
MTLSIKEYAVTASERAPKILKTFIKSNLSPEGSTKPVRKSLKATPPHSPHGLSG